MATFSLSVSSAYLPSWGPYEGLRELLQNACDSQQDGHTMEIHHDPRAGILSITNLGVRLDRSVWLLGVTTKASGGYRGIFGEGLALGILALVRSGRSCRIVNDDEDWSAALQDSKAFPGQQLLCISTRKRRTRTNAFSVQVQCSAQEWAEYRESFLDLKPSIARIHTSDTDILTAESERGRCYVKGILVETKPDLAAGYNFKAAATDRDRRMINSFDFDYYSANAWADAVRDGQLSPEQLLDHLESGCGDTKGLGERSIASSVVAAVAAAYSLRHGLQAIPVASYAEVTEAGHLGRIGLIATPALCGFFSSHPDLSLTKVRQQRRSEVCNTYSLQELTAPEQQVRQQALALVESAAAELGFDPLAHRLEIVDFHSSEIMGLHCSDDASGTTTIRVARRTLGSLEAFLRVLVHELAHDRGGDGDVRHQRAESRIFSRIVAHSLASPRTPAAIPLRHQPALAAAAGVAA